MRIETENYVVQNESGKFVIVNNNAQSLNEYSTLALAEVDSQADDEAYKNAEDMLGYEASTPVEWS